MSAESKKGWLLPSLAVVLASFMLYACGKSETPAKPPAGAEPKAAAPEAPKAAPKGPSGPDMQAKGPQAVNADGSPFTPAKTFVGDDTSTVWLIDAGPVTVKGGKLTVRVGPVKGYDGVYDFLSLASADGKEIRVEAEDGAATTGDRFSDRDATEGHWWLQEYGGFSKSKGLVVRKAVAKAPVLTTVIKAADGSYTLRIGSFKGDKATGPFALGVSWE